LNWRSSCRTWTRWTWRTWWGWSCCSWRWIQSWRWSRSRCIDLRKHGLLVDSIFFPKTSPLSLNLTGI